LRVWSQHATISTPEQKMPVKNIYSPQIVAEEKAENYNEILNDLTNSSS